MLGGLKMDNRAATIREALENIGEIVRIASYIEQASEDEGLGVEADAKRIRELAAALDALAVEPSEDVAKMADAICRLVEPKINPDGKPDFIVSMTELFAIITADRERVKAEWAMGFVAGAHDEPVIAKDMANNAGIKSMELALAYMLIRAIDGHPATKPTSERIAEIAAELTAFRVRTLEESGLKLALQAALRDDPDWRRLAVEALDKAEGRNRS
jgi:hypothetical protein